MMEQWQYQMKRSPKIICGVAAYLAHRFDWSPLWTRAVLIGCCLAAPLLTPLVYLVLAQFVVDKS
ncbi:MAG: PspC domain-containing protein [Parashewanella sp.]